MRQSAVGAGALAFAVIMGAFGAHSLRSSLDSYSLGIFEKAVFYHFIHALGLLFVPALAQAGLLSTAAATRVWILLLTGICLFSGSLYILAVTGAAYLGAVTPIGGLAFIAAWLLLATELLRR